MNKMLLLIVVAAFAAAPAAAATKHKKAKMTPEQAQMAKRDADAAKQNENCWRLAKASLPLLLPSWTLPIYFSVQDDKKKK